MGVLLTWQDDKPQEVEYETNHHDMDTDKRRDEDSAGGEMTVKDIAEKLIAGEDAGFIPLPEMYKVAEHLGADASLAKCLRGRGFQSDALIEAIDKRIKEIREAR